MVTREEKIRKQVTLRLTLINEQMLRPTVDGDRLWSDYEEWHVFVRKYVLLTSPSRELVAL